MPTKNTDFSFSIKSMQEDGGFVGYASVFGIIDSQNDVVMKGAFQNSLKKRAGDVKLLWQHQVGEPIGVFTLIREDSHGLYVEGRLLLDLQRGKEAYSLLKNVAIKGLSIGYSVVAADYNGEDNIRLITDLQLWEISLVTFPANEAAVVTSVKENSSLRAERSNPDLVEYNKDVLPCQSARLPRNNEDLLLCSLDRAIYSLKSATIGDSISWNGNPNMDVAIKYLQDHAEAASTHMCAKYVREALNAGWFDVKPSGDARNYGHSLEFAGFVPIVAYDVKNPSILSNDGYVPGYAPAPGDVAVIQPYKGGNPSGHMTMFDGQIWISDFRQSSMYPGNGYRHSTPAYVIYRC